MTSATTWPITSVAIIISLIETLSFAFIAESPSSGLNVTTGIPARL